MTVLVVDPNLESRDALRRELAGLGHQARGIATAEEAWRHLDGPLPDALIVATDADGGLDLIVGAVRRDPSVGAFALVDSTRLEEASAAVREGATDFLWRPVSAERVAMLMSRLGQRRDREAKGEEMRRGLAHARARESLAGRSPAWRGALAALERAAASDASVLITGEAGTEKEAAAVALHRLSPRGALPFEYISEGESLDVALQHAGRGSLFLPNVETTSIAFQEFLLSRIDGPWGTRFVVATDENPRDATREGRLHEPLLVALAEQTLHLPPLREREGDAALLAQRFLEEADPSLSFDPEAIEALLAHDWPGNVRELREAVRRAVRLTTGEGAVIGPTLMRSVLGRPLPRTRPRRRKPMVRITVGDSLADVERRLIQKTLEFARGNKRKTAELLKLSLKTIYNKIKEYGLEKKVEGGR